MTIPTVPLGELAQVVSGGTPKRSELSNFGGRIPWVKIGDMQPGSVFRTEESLTDAGLNSSSAKLLPAGTLLLSIFATIGRTAVLEIEAATNQAIAGLKIKDPSKVNRNYLRRYLEFASYGLSQMGRGVAQANINLSILRSHAVPLPSIEEQRRIAEVLDAAETLRAKRHQALAKLDSLTQAIFIDMFGDLASNLRGWPVRRVSEFVDSFQTGKSVAAGPDDIPGGYRVLKVSAVTSRRFRPEESKPVPSSYVPPSSHIVRAGDLLLSRANTTELVGACAFVDATPENHLLPDKLWRFVWRMPHEVEPLFVWHLLQGRRVRKEIGDLATGSSGSMKNISQKKFMQLQVPVPPLERQREFVSHLHAVRKLASSQTQGESALDGLYASLQQRAFRGEL